MQDGIDDGANTGEGEKETDGSYEQPSPRPVGNALMNHLAKWRALQQQQEKSRPGNDEKKYEPGIRHAVLKHAKCDCLGPLRFALQGALQSLIESGFCFFIISLRDFALLALDFKLEKFFLNSFHQHGGGTR